MPKCECGVTACFGLKGEIASCCATHRTIGMVNVKGKYCSIHKDKGMVYY